MPKKELTDLVKVKHPTHTEYYAYDEKDERFISLDEGHLTNMISGYRSLNEKARKRAFDSFVDSRELLREVKLPDRLPNVPPKPNFERMSREKASAAVQTLLSISTIFESPKPGFLLLADLLCGLHCTSLRQAEPTFVPAIAVRSDSTENLLTLKGLVMAAVRSERWKGKKIKIHRKAICDYRIGLGELPHHIQDFSEVKCSVLKLGKLRFPATYSDTVVLLIGADKSQLREAIP